MTSDSTIVSLRQPNTVDDPLTAVLRSSARRLLAQAIEAEAEEFLAAMKGFGLPDGRERLVRHGHGPERHVALPQEKCYQARVVASPRMLLGAIQLVTDLHGAEASMGIAPTSRAAPDW
jgi:hypothetical protein